MTALILFGLLGVLLALLPYLFTAGGEGRYRRGVGWYLDVRSSRETLMKEAPAGTEPPHTEGAPSRSIHIWLITGSALLVLAVVTWVPIGIYGLSIILGLFGLVYVLRAFSGWRENHWLRGPPSGR